MSKCLIKKGMPGSFSSLSAQVRVKDGLRDELARDVAAFLARGGVIEQETRKAVKVALGMREMRDLEWTIKQEERL